MHVLGICGSLQAKSSNLTLLHTAQRLAPAGVDVEIFDGIRDLPLFNPDIETSGSAPIEVEIWRAALRRSDAVLIASPEYGHSLPGGVKNAIDWVIGSSELEAKVVGITASVLDEARGQRGLDAIATTCRAVNVRLMWTTTIVRGPGQARSIEALFVALASGVAATVAP